jgi:hypothetical protein
MPNKELARWQDWLLRHGGPEGGGAITQEEPSTPENRAEAIVAIRDLQKHGEPT